MQNKFRELRAGDGSDANYLSHGIDATADVNKLKALFRDKIGSTWAEAIKPNTVSHVTDGPQRAKQPWKEVKEVMERGGKDAPHRFIRSHVTVLTPWFSWQK